MNAKELHRLVETITVMQFPVAEGHSSHLTVTGISQAQLAEILVLAELKLVDDNLKATRNDVHNTSS